MTSVSRTRFGDLLRYYRLKAGLTQEALAERSGVSVPGIGALERGVNQAPWRETALALADALGLDPDEREQFLAARRRSTPLVKSRRNAQSSTRVTRHGSLKLIGREYERLQIEQLLRGDKPPMLLFYGEPGIGKTRLLQDAEERAQQAGWTVLTGGSHQLDGQHPYTPLVQALERYLAGQSRSQRRQQLKGCEWMTRLLPELMDATLAPAQSWHLPPEQERRLMYTAVGRYIARIAEPVGALLVLDDLQWAAPDGLSLLGSLLRSAAASDQPNHLRVIAAARDIRLDPNHPLPAFVLDLARDSLVAVERLDPLETGQANSLLHAALANVNEMPNDEREALIQRVVARAGGVPLYLMSFAREIRANPSARGQPLTANNIPWDVAEMILHRVNGLPETARHILSIAAVYGRETPLSLLITASNLTERQVVEALEAAIAARLLIETDDATCVFVHDLFREAVLANLGVARARMLHSQVAKALESDPLRAQAGPLAFHYGHGEDMGRAALYLEHAGDQALALRAYTAAEACYRGALGYLPSDDAASASGRLQEKLGSLFMGCGKYDLALAALEEAVSSYRRASDQDGVGRAIAQIGWAHVRGGTGDRGLSRVEPLLVSEVLARLTPPTQVALLCAHAVLLFALNHYDKQLASARRAGAIAREAHDTGALAQSMRLEGLALILLGLFDEALPVTLETLRLAEEVGDLDSYSAALNDTAAVYRARGELKSSWAYSARSVEVAEQLGDPTGIAFLTTSHGENAFLLGNWMEARQNFERAVAIVREMGASWVAAYPLESLGQLNLVEGRDEEGARLLDEALAYAERDHDLQALRCAQAVLAERDLIYGSAANTLQRLQPLCSSSSPNEKDSIALLPFMSWAQISLGMVTGVADTLHQCIRQAEETGNRLVFIDALLAQARLFIYQAEWAQAEKAIGEALACSQAMTYPYAEAKARFVHGQLHTATGAYAQARKEYVQAIAICRRLGEKLYLAHIERALAQLSEM
jgi:transcriptional regulator with XRE-family HTH domain/tetratricopeptide (TPR) repeat protein